MQTIDIADPAAPKVTDDVTYDAAATTVRQHGDTIRMVLSTGLPELPFVNRGKGVSQKEAIEQNRQVVEDSTLEDWLPGYDAGDGPTDLLDCKNVARSARQGRPGHRRGRDVQRGEADDADGVRARRRDHDRVRVGRPALPRVDR